MHYMMIPLAQHVDGGLGATGEAFQEAAEALAANMTATPIVHSHLPINFLYRHAIELFLKSMVVVLHRALRVPYDVSPSDGPASVLVDGKWKPIHRVHSVGTLWAHVQYLLRTHSAELKTRCRTDWSATPDGLAAAIQAIEGVDASSTFFRYPDGRNAAAEAAKSAWKPKQPEELIEGMTSGGKPLKAFVFLDSDGESILEAFQYDDAPLAELSRLLADTAKTLSGAHTGLRVELAGGF